MPITFTIKQVPDDLADRIRQLAATERRSLQKELLVILERAATEGAPEGSAPRVSEGPAATYLAGPEAPIAEHDRAGRLSLGELWERARRLGPSGPSESTEIVRRDRDARRHRR